MRRKRRLALWRRRYRAGQERLRHTLHLTRRGFRYLRWLAWSTLGVSIILYGLFPNITWESEYARNTVMTAIDYSVTREVTVGSARMNLLGDIVLREVTIRAKEGEKIPYLARAPELIVHLAYRPLARNTVRVERVEVHEPEVHMAYYLDGTWNTAGLFEIRPPDTEPYRVDVEIEDGHYLLTDYSAATPVVWDCRQVNGELVLNNHTEYTVQYSGTAKISDTAPLEFAGQVYPARGTVTVKAQIEKAPALWTRPYLTAAGLMLTNGTLDADADLQFRPGGYLCTAQISAQATGLSWQGVALPPADGELELKYSFANHLLLERARLVRDDIELTVRGTAAQATDYDLTVSGTAFPLAWLPAVAGNAIPGLETSGTFAGELGIIRKGARRSVRLQADLAKASVNWLDLLRKPAGQRLPVRLTAEAAEDGVLRVDQLLAELNGGMVTAVPAPGGEWSVSFRALPVLAARQVSPALNSVLAEAGLHADGSAEGRLTTGAAGTMTLNLDAVAVTSAGFNKPAGVPLRLSGSYRRSPLWHLTAESWKLGVSGGRLEYAQRAGGVWQLLVVAHTLQQADLRGAFPRLTQGPLGDVSWSGPLAGEVNCTVDSRGEQYAGKISGAAAELSLGDWWVKPVGMPFTADFEARRSGEALTVSRAKIQAGGSSFRLTGASDFISNLADYTVVIDRCQPVDLRQLLTFWRDRVYQFGSWDGSGKGTMHVTRSGETTDYALDLDLGAAQCEVEEYFRKPRGMPATAQVELAVMPGRVVVRRGNLSVGRSKLAVSGSVIPTGEYQVDLTLKADIFAPEMSQVMLNLDQRRVVGYPVPTLLDSLQDHDQRIDLEWQVRGSFAKPQFELEMRKALNEGLRNSLDNRFRALGLLVEGTLRIGGRIIALPFNVLRFFTRDGGDTHAAPRREAGMGDTRPGIRQQP